MKMEKLPNNFWLGKILSELTQIKTEMIEPHSIAGHINRKQLMRFLDLSKSAVYQLEKKGQLEINRVGKRKFYSVESIKKLILKNNK